MPQKFPPHGSRLEGTCKRKAEDLGNAAAAGYNEIARKL
jgi:hypothetical protein